MYYGQILLQPAAAVGLAVRNRHIGVSVTMIMPAPRSDSLALSACRLFESDDVEETRDRISRVMQPHTLTPAGRRQPHRSHMDFLQMPGIGIGTIAFGEKTIEVPPLDGYYLLVFCIRGQALLRSGNNEVVATAQQGVMTHDQQSLHGHFSADCEQFVVRIDKKRLAAYSGKRNPVLGQAVDLKRASLQPWVTALRNLVTDDRAVQLVRDDPRIAATYGNLLIQLLVHGHGVLDTAPEPKGASPRSVHRALAFIEAHVTEPIHLEDIAEAAGVPLRTLYEAFHRFRGVSPMRHLRNLRLDHVRRQLLACGGAGNVTTIALDAGFGHLGRFSQDYAARFGEKPSETLRRA
jgi:AraC-like DNA-binding protein